MIVDDRPPADFDWVTARIQCSTEKVFASLREQAQRNVETINAVNPGVKLFQFTKFDGGFSISRNETFGQQRGVRFTSYDSTTNAIGVEMYPSDSSFTALVKLNALGQCRLIVKDEELDPWQLLQRVLEPVFFPSGR